jgi:hypothetical protein
MTVQATFLPKEEFIASKTAEERIAYVKANPAKYANKPQYDHNKNMEDKMNQILDKFTEQVEISALQTIEVTSLRAQVELLLANKPVK